MIVIKQNGSAHHLFGAALGLALVWTVPAIAQDKDKDPKKDAASESIFPDKQLEAAVRKSVYAKRNNDQPITPADVANISTIKGREMGITNLAGLEHCRALASLELPGNEIADLKPIGGLERVQLLDLSHNKITDIAPLAGMKGLQYVNLEHNQVGSLAPLAKLERLNSLYASHNQVADIGPVCGLPKLWSLYLNHNRIEKLDGIAGLERVDTFGLAGNRIADLSPLAGTVPSNALYLQDNRISDLGPLLAMCKKDLEGEKRFAPYMRIYLSGNPLDKGPGKKQLEEMKKLGLRVIEKE